MKEINTDTELQEIYTSKKGFVFNDFSGMGASGKEYNVLHKASCNWILKSNTNVHKIFFENELNAKEWLHSNREGNWKHCGTCFR